MAPLRVLVVDDAEATLEILQRQLESAGHAVRCAKDVPSALDVLESWPVELVLTDLRMPGPSGLDLVRHLRQRRPEAAVVMITGYPSIANAVEAGRTGVDDFLAKPFTDQELHAAIDRALDARRRRSGAGSDGGIQGLVAGAPSMTPVISAIRLASTSIDPVLVIGPPGSGRRHVVGVIHELSERRGGPLVWVDAERIPEHRAEDELFGGTRRVGLFEAADGGTLAIRACEHLPEIVQIRLLAAMRERRAPRPGGERSRKVDVRLVSTTAVEVDEMVRIGRLRSDFAQRVSGMRVRIPPLRERPDDLPALARAFLARWVDDAGGGGASIADDALDRLAAFDWPGNVSELEAVMFQAVAAAGGQRIEARHLPVSLRFSAGAFVDGDQRLDDVERRHVIAVLNRCGGNKTRAATILGIDRRTLRERLRRWGGHE
jgi:DNA-binding NtrC family response regulator